MRTRQRYSQLATIVSDHRASHRILEEQHNKERAENQAAIGSFMGMLEKFYEGVELCLTVSDQTEWCSASCE